MSRFFSIILSFSIWILSNTGSLFAQSDSILKREKQAPAKIVDSERNEILSKQFDEYHAIRNDQIGDSIRLLQLRKEILQLGAGDHTKRQTLTREQDLIINKDSINRALQKLKIDSLRSVVSGFPIILSRDTLFFVFTKLGSYSPRERANVVSNRILKLAENYFYQEDSLVTVPSDLTIDISYGDEVLISISEFDAVWMNSTREKLAVAYKRIIADAIKKYKIQNSWQTITKELLLALLVLTLLVLIIYFINKLSGWVKRKIEKKKDSYLQGFKIRGYVFLDTNHQEKALYSLVNIVKWLTILILVYWSLPVLFGIFPWSGGFAAKLISSFLDPIKNIFTSIWNYLPNFFTILVLVIFFRFLLRGLNYFKSEIEKGVLKIPGFYIDWANPTFQIIRVLVLAFMLIVVFPYLPGSDSQIFKGVSVFLGVLFTFGSAGALGNIVAGLVLTYMRAYRIGDRVKIGDATGDVVEKSLLVTRIKTIKNEIISIPNSTVMNSHTTNFSAEAVENGLILHTTVTIGYDTPWRQVHDLLIRAALATELIDKDPSPFVFQTSLNDFYVSYQINAYTRIANRQHITYSFLHQHIQDAFNEAGVEIMSSHYSNIRDGNKITVPDVHLPKDYVTPSFRVKDTGKDSVP